MTLAGTILDSLKCALFEWSGKKPWTRGYFEYKWKCIKAQLSADAFDHNNIPQGYGFRIDERIVEYPWLISRLPAGGGTLLDAGSALNFPDLIATSKIKEKELYVLTLAPESNCFWNHGVSYVYGDLRNTCFRDEHFDWIASLSTVEHIGLDNTLLYSEDKSKKESNPESYLDAISEFRRLLKPAGTLYLSMPYGNHKNHGWFQVFDAAMVDKLIATFSPSSVNQYYFKYTPEGWSPSSREESAHATCFDIHAHGDYDDDYAAFSRAIVCLELTK